MTGGHLPVLLHEVLRVLGPQAGEVAVDATVGLGGHAAEIARRIAPGGTLLGTDLDPGNLASAGRRIGSPAGVRLVLVHENFAALPRALAEAGLDAADVVLADLGVASPHLDDPARGFSYRKPGPLDMRLDPTRGRTAAELLATIPEPELARALQDLGDEEDADAVAREIVARRARAPIETTEDLVLAVCRAREFTLVRAAGAKLHPAARTFQALRMLVNREIPNLERLLAALPHVLRPGGRAAVLSFHSGEDRLVKRAFREGLETGLYSGGSDEPIRPSAEESRRNPRARAAKLRWVRRAPMAGAAEAG
ncbi:MAG: 16S rRNA (cytosine(1402)-N(4))-methyltransferase RsmH [Planctomycetales bacterium]|nr:16S rRNA (cytosine(1402)-N(4))-methyltransferase RsmH [Planctomycetales bacterium]